MKAYKIYTPSQDGLGFNIEIVFANSHKEASQQATYSKMFQIFSTEPSRVIVKRDSKFDNLQNVTAAELAWQQHLAHWEFYQFVELNNNKLDKQAFINLYNTLIQEG